MQTASGAVLTADRLAATALAERAARELGIVFEKAVEIRRAASIHVELCGADIIARIDRPGAAAETRRQVLAARFFEAIALPAARLVMPQRQPISYDEGRVTLWHRLEIHDGKADPATLGRVARRLHDRTRTTRPTDTPRIDHFATTRRFLQRAARRSPESGVEKLLPLLDRLAASWAPVAAADPLGQVYLHGDFHADNVVLTPDGPVLIDLEDAGIGPASWDFVPQIVAAQRYGAPPDHYQAFCRAYGEDPSDWDGLDLLCRVYELFLASWAIGHSDSSPAMAREAELRRRTLLGDSDETWTLI